MSPLRTRLSGAIAALAFTVACSSPDEGLDDETTFDGGGTSDGDATPPRIECLEPNDCPSKVCTAAGQCAAPSATDGVQNGDETDVDCGGSSAPGCDAQKKCAVGSDCASGVCKDVGDGLTCQAPSPTDGVKNGDETDVDCGGGGNPKCAVTRTCKVDDDCESDGCAYDGRCVLRRSCTAHHGGDTCGAGGAGGVGPADWESCCATAPAGNGGVQMNKYQVTAGRMRVFLERVKGDVRSVVQQARANDQLHGAILDAAWDLYLPTSMEGCDALDDCGPSELSDYEYGGNPAEAYQGVYTSALRHIGGTMFDGQSLPTQGCRIDSPGTHSYWMDAATQANYFGDAPSDYGQDVYDTKPLNCVNYLMAQAFCVWDGGRLETQAEYAAMSGMPNNGGVVNGPVPWGAPLPFGPGSNTYFAFRFPTATDAALRALGLSPADPNFAFVPPAGTSIEWATYFYSYEYPNLGPNGDFIVFLSAPGRMKARTANGHADFAGPMMEITSDVNNMTSSPKTTATRWTANGSWEGHQWGYYGWNFSLLNKYGKQSLRCVYP